MNDDTINPSTMTEAEFVLRERAKRRGCWTDLARQAVEELERKFAIEVVSIEHHEARTKSLQSSLLDFVEKSKAHHDAQAAQIALLREELADAIHVTEDGTCYVDDPLVVRSQERWRAALAATPESASAELTELRKDKARLNALFTMFGGSYAFSPMMEITELFRGGRSGIDEAIARNPSLVGEAAMQQEGGS